MKKTELTNKQKTKVKLEKLKEKSLSPKFM